MVCVIYHECGGTSNVKALSHGTAWVHRDLHPLVTALSYLKTDSATKVELLLQYINQ